MGVAQDRAGCGDSIGRQRSPISKVEQYLFLCPSYHFFVHGTTVSRSHTRLTLISDILARAIFDFCNKHYFLTLEKGLRVTVRKLKRLDPFLISRELAKRLNRTIQVEAWWKREFSSRQHLVHGVLSQWLKFVRFKWMRGYTSRVKSKLTGNIQAGC